MKKDEKNNVACYLITDFGIFEKALLPKELLINLAVSLRTKGVEDVHFENKSIKVEGIYIPAKGTKYSVIALPNMED